MGGHHLLRWLCMLMLGVLSKPSGSIHVMYFIGKHQKPDKPPFDGNTMR